MIVSQRVTPSDWHSDGFKPTGASVEGGAETLDPIAGTWPVPMILIGLGKSAASGALVAALVRVMADAPPDSPSLSGTAGGQEGTLRVVATVPRVSTLKAEVV